MGTNKTELKPCPFCGGSAEYRNDGMTGYVQCQNCLARNDSVYSWRDENWKEEVAGYWNSRTQCPEYENKQKAIESLLLHSEKLILVMQAAYIEMCNAGTDNAMRWIENTLYEKGLIPSVTKWTTAQDFFDSEIAKLEERAKNE